MAASGVASGGGKWQVVAARGVANGLVVIVSEFWTLNKSKNPDRNI